MSEAQSENPQHRPHVSTMPIYEFACPKCRKVYSFLSKRVAPSHTPACPKCGSKRLTKEISRFAFLNGAPEPAATGDGGEGTDLSGEPGMEGVGMPDMEDPRIARAMSEMERDMDHLDENNPKHMAHLLRKMKDILPSGSVPKDFEVALKRLEAGEDPEKIEADMGDVLGDLMGGEDGSGDGGGGGSYSKDPGLYDY
jgi:putative FmdB family regulatory protein